MADGTLHVIVVGAGIAGLTTTIALRQHPRVDVQVYDQATELREIGASIALSPNVSAVFFQSRTLLMSSPRDFVRWMNLEFTMLWVMRSRFGARVGFP
jgi:2-polyprenyl-6-methoxyphenol hydroxylase-like FAD-dependent oxidoreductase